jgi:hypothetical protein
MAEVCRLLLALVRHTESYTGMRGPRKVLCVIKSVLRIKFPEVPGFNGRGYSYLGSLKIRLIFRRHNIFGQETLF